MKNYIPLLYLLIIFFASCNQRKKQIGSDYIINKTAEENYTSNTSILMLDDRLNKVDSLVFVFYIDPHGQDSVRYTRFYTQNSTTDKEVINILKSQINQPTERFEKVKKCRSEGKVWCFTKGDIFQTIYFSDYGTDCSFMFFIKNGLFYYCNLHNDFKQTFSKFKGLSKEIKVVL